MLRSLQKSMSTSYDRIPSLIEVLNSTFSSTDEDRISAKQTIMVLHDLTRTEHRVKYAVDNGVIPVLVKQLKAPWPTREANQYQYLVEMASAFMLKNLATFLQEYPQLIVDAGAVPPLLELLKRRPINNKTVKHLIMIVIEAINMLVIGMRSVKILIRNEGGIPPLIELLRSTDIEVKLSTARAIGKLALNNIRNKNQIVECNALPVLVSMMRSENVDLHFQALKTIALLAQLSPGTQKRILDAGALQPVIRLIRSSRLDIQSEAVWLLGDFVKSDSNCKVHIVQSGALLPLIGVLESPDIILKEGSTLLLRNLVKDTHTQVGIVQSGGLVPLLNLLETKHKDLLHNVATILYRLAKNEDNIVDFVKEGGVSKLLDSILITEPTEEFFQLINNILSRLEEKIKGWVLENLLDLMCVGEKSVQARVVLALAHLCSPLDHKSIFIDKDGLPLLLELLTSANPIHRKESAEALCKLANRATPLSPRDAAILSSSPQVCMGEQYVNNSALCDVKFLVEGKEFYAHKESLIASSAVFRAMFGEAGYKEKHADIIEIPNIGWNAFEGMMRYIHIGSIEVKFDVALELLGVANQYFLETLKRTCENAVGKELCFENLAVVLDSSVKYNAMSLRQLCILFILKNYVKLDWYTELIDDLDLHISSVFKGLLGEDAKDC